MDIELDTAFMINAAGIAVMVYGLVQILSLGKKVPGGMVGRHWKMLTALVALFTVSYMLTPLFGSLPAESIRLIVAFVFLFGAIYVTMTVRLLYRIIDELA